MQTPDCCYCGHTLSITYPDGQAITTVYDILGKPKSLTDHDGKGITYTRDFEGRVIKESHPDGSTTEYGYNGIGLLILQKEVRADHRTRRQIDYAYDDAGNLASENRNGIDIDEHEEMVRYYYDKANKLTRAVTLKESANSSISYTYDLAGNMTSDGKYTYTYDLENRLTAKTTGSGNSARTTSYAYDNAGNLIKETGQMSRSPIRTTRRVN